MLKNEEVFVSPRLGGATFLSEQETKNLQELKSEGMVFPRKSCTVSTFPMDFFELERDYPRRIVVRKLYILLSDESRDFFAHALLTELFFPDKLCKFWNKAVKSWKKLGRAKRTNDFGDYT